MKNKVSLFICLCLLSAMLNAQKTQVLKSPDGKISVTVSIDKNITYSVMHEQTEVVTSSPVSVALTDKTWGKNPKLKKKNIRSVNEKIISPVYKKNEINDAYNELTLTFSDNYGLEFRAYDQGVAYRFTTTEKNEIFVTGEEVALHFKDDHNAIAAYVRGGEKPIDKQFFNSFENIYTHTPLSKLSSNRLIFLPMVVELNDGKKLCFTEADLENYPGLFLNNSQSNTTLQGIFAPVPKKTKQRGIQQVVEERESYIARTTGARSFPWRIFAVSTKDEELLNNDLVYALASPSRISDDSWVKPGKVAWEWWHASNIDGVNFRAGMNTETYKYYIDFAAKYGIQYAILDGGWTKDTDLLQVAPDIDIKSLIAYGKQKNVGIILWASFHAVNSNMENIFRTYSEMGAKGFKIDFMDRDDQNMVNFYYRCAAMGAKYKMMIDFHGAYKPTGLQRTYPNVINFEGVFGMEQLKWTKEVDMVGYDVTMPFIRMLAGPVDYTQGAMRNATRKNFYPVSSEPMSQGTRCHQLAEYVVFESPFCMLCDAPSSYEREQECTRFIAAVPSVWDETVSLDSKIGEYITIARRKGDVWYVGGLTNWTEHNLKVDLSFLEDSGKYRLELFKDGINADRIARDYAREIIELPAGRKGLDVQLKSGGGFACKITKIN
ncbi:MAG: glycoside hydrolase family 97 protein [Tannerella sp.]|jgi:alpha-glucosidase|nr:glycoside hydrolase family 97 protein [Tannerella sp.]